MQPSPGAPESGASQPQEFKSAVNAEELLAAQKPAEAEPSTLEERGRGYYHELTNHIRAKRTEQELLDSEGRLDVAKKFDQSAYEVLSLDYYRLIAHEQQGIPMPEQYRTDEELREFFILQTQQLIEQITTDKPDIIFYLDKSARPVAMMVRELWPLFVDDPNLKLPEQKFINIDANAVLGKREADERPTQEEISNFTPSSQQIDAIRRIYERPLGKEQAGNPSTYRPVPTHPDNYHKALVVDEIRVSGATARIADSLITNAFPNLKVEHAAWMSANIKASGRRGYENMTSTQLPAWYSKWFVEGRGIDDPDNGDFLGKAPNKDDMLNQALRTDIQLLAKDIREGRQSVRPMEGCYEIDPGTGKEDFSKPKYKIAKIAPDGSRQIIPPWHATA